MQAVEMNNKDTLKVRRFPFSLYVLFTGIFINRFGSFVSLFLLIYLTARGYTIAQAGIASSAYGLGSMFASIAGGYLADRVGRRPTIVVSMFSSAVALLLLSQAITMPLILILTCLAGLTSGLYRPAASALLTDLVVPEQRLPAFAGYRLALNLGFAAGPLFASFLASQSFFLLFLSDAISSIAFGLLALFALPSSSARHTQAQSSLPGEKEKGFLQALRHDGRFLLFLLGSVLLAFVYFQHTSTLVLQVQSFGFSNAVYGGLLSLNGIIVILLELPLSFCTKRFPPQLVIAVGWLLTALGFGFVGFATTVPLLAMTVALWTVGEILHHPASAAYVATLAPRHLQGRYQGAWDLTWGIAQTLGPLLGAMLFSWSMTKFWLLCGFAASVAALLPLLGKQDTAPLKESGSKGTDASLRKAATRVPPKAVAYGGLVLVQVLYASFAPVAMPTLERVDPVIFFCLQMLAPVPFGLVLTVRWRSLLDQSVLFRGGLLGVCLAGAFLCLTQALRVTGISETTVFSCVNGVTAVLVAWLILKQRIRFFTWIACLCALLGAAAVMLSSSLRWQGNFTAFVGGSLIVVYAFLVESLLVGDLRKKVTLFWPVLGVQVLVMAGMATLFALCCGTWGSVVTLRLPDLAAIGYTGLIATFLPMILSTLLQRHVSAVSVAFFAVLDPLLSAGFAYLYGERLAWSGYIGLGFVLLSVLFQAILGARSGAEAAPSDVQRIARGGQPQRVEVWGEGTGPASLKTVAPDPIPSQGQALGRHSRAIIAHLAFAPRGLEMRALRCNTGLSNAQLQHLLYALRKRNYVILSGRSRYALHPDYRPSADLLWCA